MNLVMMQSNTYGHETVAVDSSVDDADIERGRLVWKKSKCAFCHGWAGDGHGHPRSPGIASNLRSSKLDRTEMEKIIRCGLPGTIMPYHDRQAYKDTRCFDMNDEELASDKIPNKGISIREDDLERLVEYIYSSINGRGPVTLEECEIYFKSGSRNCLHFQ